MAEATAAMDVRTPSASASIIDIRGEVTASSDGALRQAYEQASGERTRAVILNFTQLEYMNSSLNEHYRQIFNLTRLDEAIGIHSDEAEALAAAGV